MSQNQPIVIPMEDDLVHTDHDPFCSDPECPCHFDGELIEETLEYVSDGLLTGAEAVRLFDGRQL